MGIELKPGMSMTRTVTVDEGRTISFMGEEGRVYATPMFVQDVEQLCRDFIVENVEAGNDSVGISVSIKHTAPTLPGMSVTLTATITEVDGKRIAFEVSGKDELDEIGTCKHQRFVVSVEQTAGRLAAKRAKFQAL